MDSSPDWTATGLFSPSKALAQQAQAKDWASVDAWLSKKYASKRLPPFERNEDTLQALLTLATLNDSADEQRSLIDRIEKASLQAFSRRRTASVGTVEDEVFEVVTAELEESEALEALAGMAVVLDCPDSNVGTIGKAIVELTDQKFAAEQQLRRTEDEVRVLKAEQVRVRAILEDLQHDDFEPPSNLLASTSAWIRNAKQLKAKISEYDDRLASLSASQQPKTRFEDITQLSKDLALQQGQLAELNIQLKAYQDLPSDPKAARAKLEGARTELRGLVQDRDRLFEGLVSNG